MQPETPSEQPAHPERPPVAPNHVRRSSFDVFHVWIRNILVLDLAFFFLVWRPMLIYNEQLYWEINDSIGIYIFAVSMVTLTLFTITAIIAVQRKRNAKNQS